MIPMIDDDYARIAERARDIADEVITDSDYVRPPEVITPDNWFSDCSDWCIPDDIDGCEDLRLALIDVLEAEEGSRLLSLAALGMVIRDAYLNSGMTVDHLRKPQ